MVLAATKSTPPRKGQKGKTMTVNLTELTKEEAEILEAELLTCDPTELDLMRCSDCLTTMDLIEDELVCFPCLGEDISSGEYEVLPEDVS